MVCEWRIKMANSQPANSTISVYRRVRTQRRDERHDVVKNVLSPGLRTLELVAPGEEGRVTRTYNTAFKTDRYWRGHQVYVNTASRATVADAVADIDGIELPFQIGRDKFINKNAANLSDDLHADARAV